MIFGFIFNIKRLNFNILMKKENRKSVHFSRIVAKFFPQISNKKVEIKIPGCYENTPVFLG